MNKKDKNEILLSALTERYSSIHIIRERVHSTSIWLLGILLGISGWIIQEKIIFSCSEKIFFICGIFVTWLIIVFFYYSDLRKGFKTQREIAGKIENELGFYESENSIYPIAWKTPKEGAFFRNNYIIIGYGFISLLITIIIFT